MKKCSEIIQSMSLYLDGRMASDDRIEFEAHLEACAGCRSELNEVRLVMGLCHDAGDIELPQSFGMDLHNRLVAVQREEKSKSKIIPFYQKYAKVLSSAAAMILLVFAVKSFYDAGVFSPVRTKTAVNSEAAMQASQAMMGVSDTFEKNADQNNMQAKSAGTGDYGYKGHIAVEGQAQQDPGASRSGTTAEIRGGGVNAFYTVLADQMVITNVNISVQFSEDMDVSVQEDDIRKYALQNGAQPAFIPFTDGAASKSVSGMQAPQTTSATANSGVTVRIPNAQYDLFVEQLTVRYGSENIVVNELEKVDIVPQLDSLNAKLAELEEKVKQKETGGGKVSESMDELRNERDAVIEERERLDINSGYTYITIQVQAEK